MKASLYEKTPLVDRLVMHQSKLSMKRAKSTLVSKTTAQKNLNTANTMKSNNKAQMITMANIKSPYLKTSFFFKS